MTLNPLTGTATTSVKLAEFNTFIAALNAEIATLAERLDQLANEPDPVIPPDQSAAVTALGARIDQLEARPELSERLTAFEGRIEDLESMPGPVIPPDLTDRVEALEHLIQRAPAENPAPQAGTPERVGRPAGIPANEMTLVYDRATIYYQDMELYADRIGENRWRLYAQLNYMVISPALWTYDEIVEGTADDVYAHAVKRLEELAKLKPIHDSVHERVVAMSEGRP